MAAPGQTGQQHRRRRRVGCQAVAVLVVVLLAGGCTSDGASTATSAPAPSAPAPTDGAAAAPDIAQNDAGGLEEVPRIVAEVAPSVVTVIVPGGNGSGVVYTADGLILTNEHVVRGNRRVQVAFADGQRVDGVVTAVDEVTDLALVQADRRDLPPARFATELPEVGTLAVVIGSPLGFQNTVTAGIISGLHREIPGSAAQGQSLVDLIQTDAPISPGNSGGAVVGSDARVVGISEAYIPPQAGAVALGFAIPAATAVDVAEQLRTTGRARHAFAGLVPAPITPQVAQRLGLDSTEGVIVAGLAEGGPAARAGLRPGDVIRSVDDESTSTPEDFLSALRQQQPGDTVTLNVRRVDGSDGEVPVTLTDRPSTSR
jgi:S1-C subfamily serine protease